MCVCVCRPGSFLSSLAPCGPSLRSLVMAKCSGLCELAGVRVLSGLTALDISHCGRVSVAQLVHLSGLTRLTSVQVRRRRRRRRR